MKSKKRMGFTRTKPFEPHINDQAHRTFAARLLLMLLLLGLSAVFAYEGAEYLLSFRRAPFVVAALDTPFVRSLPDPGKQDINLADETSLSRVSGIGPALARRILALREERGGFHFLEELLDVQGLGEKRYAALSEIFFCLSPSERFP